MSDALPATRPSRQGRAHLALASLSALVVVPILLAASRQEPEQEPDLAARAAVLTAEYDDEIQWLLDDYCIRCHGPRRQRGDVRLDVLDPDMVNGHDAEHWKAALDMIQGGAMPPERADKPDDEERRRIIEWMTDSLDAAAQARAGERHTVIRRLTRAQYTHSLQDLLGLSVDFGQRLPSDGKSKMGFSNNGEVLQASPLHLDTYQEIARAALDQAIVVGEKPAPTHYRVTFGKGIGKGLPAGHTGGYQAVPLDRNDFVVDVLDAHGEPQTPSNVKEKEALDALKQKISVGLRGSSRDRFRVMEEGMVLYSALPHREKAPGSWQGPSPNVKIEMQRCFPETGDFVMRVRASHGYLPTEQEELLIGLDDPQPLVTLAEDGRTPESQKQSLVFAADDVGESVNLTPRNDTLVPVEIPKDSFARFLVDLKKAGFYQFDLVHPTAPPDAMPSARLTVDGFTLDMRFELTEDELARERLVTPIGAAYLKKGQHDLEIGGPFFVGFSHVVVTPIPAEHPAAVLMTPVPDRSPLDVERGLPAIRGFVGTRTDDGMDYKPFADSRAVEAPLGQFVVHEFFGRLENLPIPEPESGDKEILSGIMLVGLWNDHLVKDAKDPGPPLLVESLEFEAPYYAEWPPASHRAIFFDSFVSDDEEAYTEAVLARFLERAFRRPVRDAELARYMDFWRRVRDDFEHYEHGVREVLVAALCSPNFLYLAEPVEADAAAEAEGPALPDAALASRLAYFLWNSPPDAELRALASSGRLRAELGEQVDRMLDHPFAERFVRAFTYEWLRLDRLEDMTVNVDAYPRFTRFVKADMAEETYRFVHEVVRRDLDVGTLIDSDFAMLNQNLAEFYGVDGVRGTHFRAVPVPAQLRRGGLLSQGAFLTGHSDGTQAHTIKRAVWLKEKILGDPPMPPPPNVPDLDPEAPEFQGLSLKQQLELHRDKPACMDCHAAIDPYGVVFEQYDAVGLFRPEREGAAIDASSTLPDGTTVDGVDGIKAYLLEAQKDAFAGALVEHLFAYALGRDLHFADEHELRQIQAAVREGEYRMRAVIRAIVASPSFTEAGA